MLKIEIYPNLMGNNYWTYVSSEGRSRWCDMKNVPLSH